MNASTNVLSADFRKAAQSPAAWRALCSREDLVANSVVVAWHDGVQVALLHLPHTAAGEKLYAIDNRDPQSGANVIGRGIVGQLKGDLVIASPLYKQHFRLADGVKISSTIARPPPDVRSSVQLRS
ncbi:nitrite reductase (NAD(P)H) small subunit [Pseudomonas paeninsulae]|uniref:nitrite reductase (NAD(P)H) small subunit n=1 Tax=Pseudomonas paeninsulae TaxID=3110772 RepID=UPI002D7796AD|nr:nitrite reductase (NAD(P)H) small subunit [Pseudomonas sp. IT1137]